MTRKKMGRPPSDNPYNDRIFVRVDDETKRRLDECTKSLNTTRSDAVRTGIKMVHDTLK